MATISKDFIVKGPFPEVTFPRCDLWSYIKRTIATFPNEIAIEDPLENKVITFKELGDLVENLAHNFIAYSISVATPIAVCMTNCLECVLVILTTWRLGGAVSMINPLLSPYEINSLLKLLNSEYVFCNDQTVEKVITATSTGTNIKRIISKKEHPGCWTFDYKKSGANQDPIPYLKIDPFVTTAAIPFSSGTTGPQKGVELTHAGIIEQIEASVRIVDLHSSKNGIIIYQPFSHIYGLGFLMSLLGLGKRVIIMQQFDLEKYIQLTAKYKIDKLFLVPPIIVMLCKSGIIQKYDLSHVKLISSGAAPLSKNLEDELQRIVGPAVQISQGYGMTETANGCIVTPYSSIKKYQHPQGTIGWPISNTLAKVIDNNGKNLGPNQIGEVCVKANYVLKGYYENPESTANIFDADRWLHTGDIGYFDDNGYFFIVDRIKELIKYKGYQVAPSEIEALLLTHKDVADVGVTSVPDLEAGELPQAWVVKKSGTDVTESCLQSFVKGKVAAYKHLRGGIKFVDAIPKSASGKILRRIMKDQAKLSSKL